MRKDKEDLLKQHSVMVWFTGFGRLRQKYDSHCSGRELRIKGIALPYLDGDNIRSGINNNLGFTEADRVRISGVYSRSFKLFLDTGVITIAAFISPNNDIRKWRRTLSDKTISWRFIITPLDRRV